MNRLLKALGWILILATVGPIGLIGKELITAEAKYIESRPYRSRTCDTLIKSQVLYQLS